MTEECVLQPPSLSLRGMKKLDRELFTKSFFVPTIVVNAKNINGVLAKVKKYLLKLQNYSPVQNIVDDGVNKQILIQPDLVQSTDRLKEILCRLNILEEVEVKTTEITVSYDNWDKNQLLCAILPEELKGGSSFSVVGHILHLNLREFMEPYKFIVAQILLDKVANISVVVNKIDIIDNTDSDFRSFAMEKLAGEGDMIATVKENGCNFKLDFSKVYWNTRLSTEHNRIVARLNKLDILFDVMAGVGPFSIPAAKKACQVFANDLNPISVKYLKENSTINRVEKFIDIYNIDGNIFIKSIFRDQYLEYLKTKLENLVHITMNLPSISLNFLTSFINLYEENDVSSTIDPCQLPILHIYFFTPTDCEESAFVMVAEKLYPFREEAVNLLRSNLIRTTFVRRVSASKVMMRVSCRIPADVLIATKSVEPICKKIKLS